MSGSATCCHNRRVVSLSQKLWGKKKNEAIGKLVLGALRLAGSTAAMRPPPSSPYGGYGLARLGTAGAQWASASSGLDRGVGQLPAPVFVLPPPVVSADGYNGYGPVQRADLRAAYSQGTCRLQPWPDGNPQRPEYWYFCANPEGYYPYVHDCDDWQQEPAQGGAPPGDYPEYQDDDFRPQQ